MPPPPGVGTATESTADPAALAAAERHRLPRRRDLSVAVVQERVGDATTNPDADFGVRVSRAIYM